MKYFLFAFLFLLASAAFGQKEVVWMDFINVKEGHEKEALFFYENNWKFYRDSALKAGLIKSYRLLKTTSDSAGTNLVLLTEYHSMEDFQRREEFFQPIIKALRPNGPVFLNALKRDSILSISQSFLTTVVF